MTLQKNTQKEKKEKKKNNDSADKCYIIDVLWLDYMYMLILNSPTFCLGDIEQFACVQ